MEQGFHQLKVDDEHLEDTVEADFVGATLAITSDTEGMASSREDLNSNPDDADTNANIQQRNPANARNQSSNELPSPNSPPEDDTKEFFAMRAGAFENAVEACHPVMLKNIDGELLGAWLLTEIDHWDAEKERVIMLTEHSLLMIKYDFITLKVADYKRSLLKEFDKIVIGEFSYPDASVVPRVDKLVSFVKGFVWGRLKKKSEPNSNIASSNALCVGLQSRRRAGRGVRAMWNKGRPPQITESWNPWCRNIPWITFASHPLKTQSGRDVPYCDIEHFLKAFLQAVRMENDGKTKEDSCLIEERPIVIDNYLGIASFFHNVNNLGFFKSRGKVSF